MAEVYESQFSCTTRPLPVSLSDSNSLKSFDDFNTEQKDGSGKGVLHTSLKFPQNLPLMTAFAGHLQDFEGSQPLFKQNDNEPPVRGSREGREPVKYCLSRNGLTRPQIADWSVNDAERTKHQPLLCVLC